MTGAVIDVPDELIDREEAERRQAIVKWQRERLKYDLEKNHVVYVDQAEAVVGRCCAEISERLQVMRADMIAQWVRSGMGRRAVEEMVDEPILSMIDSLNRVDVTVDPSEDETTEAKDEDDGETEEEGS